MKNGGDERDGTHGRTYGRTYGRTDASFRGSVGSQLTGVEIDLKRDSGRRGMLPLLIARFHDDVTLGVGGTREIGNSNSRGREGGRRGWKEEGGRGGGGKSSPDK